MSTFVLIFSLLHWAVICLGAPQSLSELLARQPVEQLPELPCLDVMAQAEQGAYIFLASEVWACISQVPFNAAVASRFVDYFNRTMQFQSTLAYLKNPPAGYQQSAVDVQHEINVIKSKVDSGAYKSQYTFEADLKVLVSSIHDNHVILDSGILSAFKYASPYSIISLSEDGVREPKIYLQEHIIEAAKQDGTPSPISKINGIDAVDYLDSIITLNSNGYVEPHADWNELMESPALRIQGFLSLFQSITIYPGHDLNFTLEDGSTIDTVWYAIYDGDRHPGPLSTPGDFYNYFVLGWIPAGYDPSKPWAWWPEDRNLADDAPEPIEEPKPNCHVPLGIESNWCEVTGGFVEAYPSDPIVVQQNFSNDGAPGVTGYVLDEISTGVLSIPSFYQTNEDIENFFEAVQGFIGEATRRDTKRVVIDLQQNYGGLVLLALTTFQQFFPELKPNSESRIRSHDTANQLGTAYMAWWESTGRKFDNYSYAAASEWIPATRINAATGTEFSTWSEYFGPVTAQDDLFSNRQLYNLSNPSSDEALFVTYMEAWVNSKYIANRTKWAPEDIVLLTDGLCSSACSLFSELMTQIAGVRTVSVGGRPTHGPMQTASGSRGAAPYAAAALDRDLNEIKALQRNMAAVQEIPLRNDTGMRTYLASINIRDQMRRDEPTPLQFLYEPSDCRIFYTPQNVFNMSRLWTDAVIATWDDSSRCAANSTGYSARTEEGRKEPPKRTNYETAPFITPNDTLIESLNSSLITMGIIDARPSRNHQPYTECAVVPECDAGFVCKRVPLSCPGQAIPQTTHLTLCLPTCKQDRFVRDTTVKCKYLTPAESVDQTPSNDLPPLSRRVAPFRQISQSKNARQQQGKNVAGNGVEVRLQVPRDDPSNPNPKVVDEVYYAATYFVSCIP